MTHLDKDEQQQLVGKPATCLVHLLVAMRYLDLSYFDDETQITNLKQDKLAQTRAPLSPQRNDTGQLLESLSQPNPL